MRTLISGHEGQGLVEYVLIISLVAILLVASLFFLKDRLVGLFGTVGSAI